MKWFKRKWKEFWTTRWTAWFVRYEDAALDSKEEDRALRKMRFSEHMLRFFGEGGGR